MHYDESLREQKKLVQCADGTNTFFSVEFDEAYHSTKDGALNESLEKHVKPALALTQGKEQLTILDICFGLGYNTFATLYHIKQQQLDTKIHILSPEFDEGLVRSLERFDYPPEFDTIRPIIKAVSQDLYYEDDQFKIEVLLGDARKSIPNISPSHNPLLWTREYFAALRSISKEDAVLTTYSTAAAVRLGLYENGFHIFIHRSELVRDFTVASLKKLDTLEYVDMELKKLRNAQARSLKDADYLKDVHG